MSAPLAPCPFCGSNRIERRLFPPTTEGPAARQTGMVSCGSCRVVGPTQTGQSLDEAIERWNMRASDSPF
ncbi:Lar family restriction alleviation protein [Accumulibacter sp.]|uniref:Lar family restriction alleviation protein n=1 Tax=Accumulibacter sp. TaxID=2053492 RepID=UPI0038FC08B5